MSNLFEALDTAVRDLKRAYKRAASRQATLDDLYDRVAKLRTEVAEAAMAGRDADVQDLSRVLRNTNNRIDRILDAEDLDDDGTPDLTDLKAAVVAAVEAI